MKKLYLVDVSGMIFRAFYAIRPLSTPAGLPVNALYGFVSMTVKLMRDVRPEHMAFCFDTKVPTFRKELDPRYKANRVEMPEALVPQMPYFQRLAEAMGIPCLSVERFEADDIIGTLTRMGREHGMEVVIVSGDKDFAQLVRPHVSLLDTMKDTRTDEAGVREKWGVRADQMIDYLAIVGDSSDNVPGVAGLGPKGAQKLLQEFGTLESVYENLEHISSESTRKKLIASREEAFLSKKLVTIVCDMNLGVDVEALNLKPILREELAALLTELDFKAFSRILLGTSSETSSTTQAASSVSSSSQASAEATADASLGAAADAPVGLRVAASVGVAVGATVEATVEAKAGVDLGPVREERYDLTGLQKWLVQNGEAWAIQSERGVYLAQANQSGPGYTIAEVAANPEQLGALISEKNLRLKGFDLKQFVRAQNVQQYHVQWDQMLAAYVVRAGAIESPLLLFKTYNGVALPELPSPAQTLTAHIWLETQLRRRIAAIGGERVLFEIEQPLVPILVDMERAGIRIDREILSEQSIGLTRDIATLEADIHSAAGEVFNIGSPKQLGRILFEKLQMPRGKKTKTGYSTDNEVLENLAEEFPITSKVLLWRELSKLKSTYVDALPQLIDATTGRIHTTYNQALTSTGRLSSTHPNLQNIPIRTERGNAIRRAFIADSGNQLISADYSQIELRILAHITNDSGLVRAFENNQDIHAATAAEVFEVSLQEVTPDMRRKAKAVNFGLAYGQSAFGLAETLRIPRSEATEIITRYFTRFPGVKTYMTDTVEQAKKDGFVETLFGRRRYLDELRSSSGMVRKFGERAAINAPIQGAASDLVKLAMISVGRPVGANMLLQVHDELVLETKSADAEAVAHQVAVKMESAAHLRVPLRVNTAVGANWQAAH